MYTLDTNAIIYYLNGDVAAAEVLRPILSRNASLYVSTITELELFAYPQINEDEAARIESLLRSAVIIPVDSRVARIAGAVRRQYRLKTADSAVAGTALLTQTTLVTRNVRDFQNVQQLSLLPV